MVMASIKHVQQALGLSQSLMQIVHKFWTYLALGLVPALAYFEKPAILHSWIEQPALTV